MNYDAGILSRSTDSLSQEMEPILDSSSSTNPTAGVLVKVGPSPEELTRWIEVSGENDLTDAKGPMAWDGADASASLAKDIAAFANSRDGGVIVIGKTQAADGSFRFTGLTSEQAATFETTRVSQWTNVRFSPPIHLACYQTNFKDCTFVIIVIEEFEDIPTLCIKSFQDSSNPKNHLLREGTIYIRNQNAESKPVTTSDELRTMIGLATRKRGNELLAHVEAMLRGRSLSDLNSAPDLFEREVKQVQSDLSYDPNQHGWWVTFHPKQHLGMRWTTSEDLKRVIAEYSVRVYEEFPPHQNGTINMGWGIANDLYGENWALTKTGLFCFWKEFRENQIVAERTGFRGTASSPIPSGEWIEYTWAIHTMVDLFMFLSRFVAEYPPGQDVHINIKIGSLAGRKLVTLNTNILMGYGVPESCRAPYFVFDNTVGSEELRASWETICADALKQLFELFNHAISQETLLKWVDNHKSRRF